MNIRLPSWSSLLFLSLASACASHGSAVRSSTTSKASDYYMLATGTTWVYDADFLGHHEQRTVLMEGQHDGFWIDDSGGKIAYDGEGLRDERRYLLKEPIRSGNGWTSLTALGASEHYEITSAGHRCTSGKFQFEDCVEVHSTMAMADGAQLENALTFARGVGLVRISTVMVRGDVKQSQVAMTLVDFRAP